MLLKKNLVLQEELCIKQHTANQKYVFSFADKQRRQKQAAALNVAIMMAVTESQAEYLNELRKCVERPACLLYTSPSPRDLSTSRMPSSA